MQSNYASRLGYPANAKLLMLHADDVGVCHSINRATMAAFRSGAITSASIEVPAPWFGEIAEFSRRNPQYDFGLHLDLSCEWKTLRWPTVTPRDQAPSLIDPLDGCMWGRPGPQPASSLIAQHARLEEVEREIRAQIERALTFGLHPTHLDSHQTTLFAKPEFYASLRKVAVEYGIPFIVSRRILSGPLAKVVQPEDPVFETYRELSGPATELASWPRFYAKVFDDLKPGLNTILFHLAFDDDEMKAVAFETPDWGSAWRQADYDFVTSSYCRQLISSHGVKLINWRDVARLWPHSDASLRAAGA